MSKKILPLVHALLIAGQMAIGQQTGNIVAYFGQEKIETTSEGTVIHHFKKGYALKDVFPGGMLFTGRDFIAWQLASGNFKSPEIRPEQIMNVDGKDLLLSWQPIEADSSGKFTGGMQSAYLYTSFFTEDEMTVLLDATGHTRVFINGLPHEGDHYDYGYTLIPVTLRKGLNEFIFTPGRFGRVKAKLVKPGKAAIFSKRDMTLPGIIIGETEEKWAAIRVLNTTGNDLTGLSITCLLETGEKADFETGNIISLITRKCRFKIPSPTSVPTSDTIVARLLLSDKDGNLLDSTTITLKNQRPDRRHERTFVSNIDGSVQYYSVAPSLSTEKGQAFVLSTHGASVEATSQTRAYKQKDWAHIVAPTNRRPFGFNWEEWGRMDALEVMIDALRYYDTDPHRRYLTGHSMGGHGSWFLGATYPDLFAAIGPCAGYPDIITYRRGSDSTSLSSPHFAMIRRGAAAGRTETLARNYLQSGVYVLHGSADEVVSPQFARGMRNLLGGFHNNFCYYEYPGGSHWYGDHSMDWPPLFDFLRQNKIPKTTEVRQLEFTTASPGVSATNYWIRINRQQKCYQLSSVSFQRSGDTISGTATNVESLTLLLSKLDFEGNPVVKLDGKFFSGKKGNDLILEKDAIGWKEVPALDLKAKHPARYGGFKLAFDRQMLFVFATGGSPEINEWYKNKARFDAETFLYRGNGSVDLIPDTLFSPEKFPQRNIIIYGNADNNMAWSKLLQHSPVQVFNNRIEFGDDTLEGENLGTYFLYPRSDSDFASVGVVAGTGPHGMKAAFANDYFSGITGFPDLLIFNISLLSEGLEGMIVSGFFGNQWDVETGEFVRTWP